MLSRLILLCLGVLFLSCHNDNKNEDSRPNIVLILVDDLAYSDIGTFGSEIKTPNIDALAMQGQKFANFYTSPMCAASRAMLISGSDNHIEGMGRMMNRKPSNTIYKGKPYYEEDISDRIVAFPKLLQKDGYYTCMSGKWHLGWEDSSDPILHGFDDTYALKNGFSNHYDARNYGISDTEGRDTISFFTKNGKATEYPIGKHSTEVYTDEMISYFKKANELKKPLFAYIPFTAPHWPLQVNEKYSDPYKGQYDKGYRALSKSRLEKLKKKGFIAENVKLPEYSNIDKWETLSPHEQKIQARKMEIYAGMVTHLDQNIGRLITALKENGQYENTIFMLFSDNGAGAGSFEKHPIMSKFENDTVINSLENLGSPSSFATIGKNWAQACAVPFKKYKGNMYEGGITSPFIVSGPGFPKNNVLRKGFFTIQDIAPTILELADSSYPLEWKGKTLVPQRGSSVQEFLKGKSANPHEDNYVFAMEHRDAAIVRKNNWKLVNSIDAADNSKFELYDISTDISEQHNIADTQPDTYNELLEYWETFKKEAHIMFIRD